MEYGKAKHLIQSDVGCEKSLTQIIGSYVHQYIMTYATNPENNIIPLYQLTDQWVCRKKFRKHVLMSKLHYSLL